MTRIRPSVSSASASTAGGEAFIGEDGGEDAGGEFSQPREGGPQLLVRLPDSGDQPPVGLELVFEMGAGELQRERKRDESLLGAIVQVALEPAPLERHRW